MKKERSNRVGARHVRVGLEITDDSLRVIDMWPVDQPVVQLDRLSNDLLIRVDVPGLGSVVDSVSDPRKIRGVYRDKRGHAHISEDVGNFYVSIPYVRLDELRNVTIRVGDVSGLDLDQRDRAVVMNLFDDPPKKMRPVFVIDTEALRGHSSWAKIPGAPGVAAPEAKIKVYRDAEGLYGWKLMDDRDDVLAHSRKGYDSREDCIKDLRWARTYFCEAAIISTDLLGGADKQGEPSVKETPSEPRDPKDYPDEGEEECDTSTSG